jgi:hypothetical protein
MSREIKTNIHEQGTEVAAAIIEENVTPESGIYAITQRGNEAQGR